MKYEVLQQQQVWGCAVLSKTSITIVDYGVGNILSVTRAFENFGIKVILASDGESLIKAERIILPGVGAFANAMKELKKLELVDALVDVAHKGTPVLGICLGMQLLLDESDEFGVTKGLGLIPGLVEPIANETTNFEPLKTPQIGWNKLVANKNESDWEGTFLKGYSSDDDVYFVHSFMAKPTNEKHRLANCIYGGHKVCAVVAKENITGCQFHPEKSGQVGLNLLQQFLMQ